MHITSLSSSPSERSRAAWLTQFALTRLEGRGTRYDAILVRQLPAAAVQAVEQADLIVPPSARLPTRVRCQFRPPRRALV